MVLDFHCSIRLHDRMINKYSDLFTYVRRIKFYMLLRFCGSYCQFNWRVECAAMVHKRSGHVKRSTNCAIAIYCLTYYSEFTLKRMIFRMQDVLRGFPLFIPLEVCYFSFSFLTVADCETHQRRTTYTGLNRVSDGAVNINAFYYKNYNLPENCF